jgi:hypothetical protein
MNKGHGLTRGFEIGQSESRSGEDEPQEIVEGVSEE